jgi:hypothetical protein
MVVIVAVVVILVAVVVAILVVVALVVVVLLVLVAVIVAVVVVVIVGIQVDFPKICKISLYTFSAIVTIKCPPTGRICNNGLSMGTVAEKRTTKSSLRISKMHFIH